MMGEAATDTFTLVLALATPADELQRWFDHAAVGERVIYASGIDLPRESEAAKLVSKWVEIGAVRPFQRRHPHDRRQFQYLIERCKAGTELKRREAQPDLTELQLAAMMRELRRAAHHGELCPSRSALAEAVTGQRNQQARRRASYLMQRLEQERRIKVDRPPRGSQHGPVVTILERGKAQGMSTAKQAHQTIEGEKR